MHSRNFARCWSAVVGLTFLSISGIAGAAGEVSYVAGTKPHERPAHVPYVNAFPKTPEWYQDALTGLEGPYLNSLQFLDAQGRWYTPFVNPGMPGPYDIRKWHQ